MKVGEFRADVISDGVLWLDGGAMFGVVPKSLWSRTIPVDDQNRVPLETSCLLVRGQGTTVLIETGMGRDYSEKQHQFYNFDFSRSLLDGLSAQGVAPEDIDVIIQTHLHFDHCGMLAVRGVTGAWTPTFPRAEVFVQKGEWEAAHNPDPRSAPSYLPHDFYKSIADTGRLRLVEGSPEILPGITVRQWGGHTRHHQAVEIRSGGDTLIYAGDFIPMTRHINLAYSMGYDMFPITTLRHKEEFLPQAAAGGWLVVFEHDPDTPVARIVADGRKYRADPLA